MICRSGCQPRLKVLPLHLLRAYVQILWPAEAEVMPHYLCIMDRTVPQAIGQCRKHWTV